MEEILNGEVLGESDFDEDDMDDAVLILLNNDVLGNTAQLYG